MFVLGVLLWAVTAVTATVLAVAVLVVGWQVVAAFAVGVAGTLGVGQAQGWNRHRQLRELVDWLGEDLQARKAADLRDAHARARRLGRLP